MFGKTVTGFFAVSVPRAVAGLAILGSVFVAEASLARTQHQLTTEALGRLLGAARGCSDSKALGPLAACLDRYGKQNGIQRELIAAARKAQRSPWLERPGVCARVSIAVREMALWKTVCRDLGPPPY